MWKSTNKDAVRTGYHEGSRGGVCRRGGIRHFFDCCERLLKERKGCGGQRMQSEETGERKYAKTQEDTARERRL
jgi:hypothetical protein